MIKPRQVSWGVVVLGVMMLMGLAECGPASPEKRAVQAAGYERNLKMFVVEPREWVVVDGEVRPVFKISLVNRGGKTIQQLALRGELKGGDVYHDVQVLEPLLSNKYHTIPGNGGYLQFEFAFMPKPVMEAQRRALAGCEMEYSFKVVELDFTGF